MNNLLQTLCRHFQVFRDVRPNTFAGLLLHILIVALRNNPKVQANRCRTSPNFFAWGRKWLQLLKQFSFNCTFACNHITYTFNTKLMHKFLLINYCYDMFRPQFFPIFRELTLFCKLCIKFILQIFHIDD